MRLQLVVAIGVISTTLLPTSASAQNQPVQPPAWSLSLGIDPSNLDLEGRDPGVDARLVANLTRSWQSPNSRFGRHLALMVGADLPYRTDPNYSEQCYGCSSRISQRYAGLTAGTTFDVARISRFTPYLKTGAGVYYNKLSLMMDPNTTLPGTDPRYFQSGFSFGANAGLGLRARFASREFFVEQMLHTFDLTRRDKGVYPLNIGIRF